VLATVIAPFVVLLLFSIADNLRAEPSSDQPTTSIVLGDRGGLTPEPPVLVPAQEGTAPSIEVGHAPDLHPITYIEALPSRTTNRLSGQR
jgi:hypothetical protein